MSVEVIAGAAAEGVFRPRQHFNQLAKDHVPFDELLATDRFEAKALERATTDADTTVVGVVGPRGSGKSSLIAHVCSGLPETHVALRVPVTGADDPSSVSAMASVALGQALDDLDLERYQSEALKEARADGASSERSPGGLRGGTLGGGAVPVELQAELGTLREQFTTNSLAADRLSGLDRLITILAERHLEPVFVLEDTEAAIGGQDEDLAEGFLTGPIHAFVHEIEAPALIAIQDVFSNVPAFGELAASMTLVNIPTLGQEHARGALSAIVQNRLGQHNLEATTDQLVGDEAIQLLIGFYDESARNLRFTLAALQAAVDYAADSRAEQIRAGHMRAGISDWRGRLSE